MEILIYFIGGLIASILTFYLLSRKYIKEQYQELFVKKNLPVKTIVALGKQKVYLYNLQKKEGKIDREDYTYARIAKMINADLEIKAVDGEIVMDVPDYTDPAFKFKMIDIIALVTNFNYAQFIFKGDDMVKLYSMSSEFTETLKAHALDIIEEITLDIVEIIEEGINNPSE